MKRKMIILTIFYLKIMNTADKLFIGVCKMYNMRLCISSSINFNDEKIITFAKINIIVTEIIKYAKMLTAEAYSL